MSDEPFSDLEAAARKQQAEDDAAKQIKNARARLVLSKDGKHAFFSALSFKLRCEPEWAIPTAATDGRLLLYNPAFWVGLTPRQQVGVFVHELMHCALQHHARLGHREPQAANIAMDLAVNSLVKHAGFELPATALYPDRYGLPEGLSFEEYYAKLPRQGKQSGEGEGDGDGTGQGQGQGQGQGNDPGGCGGVQKPGDGSEADRTESEAEWKTHVAEAAEVARKRGALPAGLEQLVAELLQPTVNWRDVLADFVTRYAKNDYAMVPPSRRFLHQGLHLPSLHSQELGEIVVLNDTSGSCWGYQQRFASELEGVLAAYDVTLTILHHETRVTHTQTWKPSDGPLSLESHGGGGTSHRQPFRYIEEQGLEPVCCLCLTDLESDFPPAPPDYPVLWVVPKEYDRLREPWGQRISIGE